MNISEERRAKVIGSMIRLRAYHEIQNGMGRAVIALNHGRSEDLLAQFALGDPRVTLEFADEGIFRGGVAVETFVRETVGRERRIGEMIDLHLTTPIVEIAGDAKSARCVWWCPGAGAMIRNAGPEAIWVWGMIASNWIRTEDEWQILNLHYFRFIKCSYDRGWVEDTSMINRENVPMHRMASVGTYHNPYSPLSIRVGVPAAPRPYSTYDGNAWMISQDKSR